MARELGIDASTLSKWVAQASPEEGSSQSVNPFQMAENLRRLKRENEILLKASAFFASRQL